MPLVTINDNINGITVYNKNNKNDTVAAITKECKRFKDVNMYNKEKESLIILNDKKVEFDDKLLKITFLQDDIYQNYLQTLNYVAQDTKTGIIYKIGDLIHKGSKASIYNVIDHELVFKVYDNDDDSYTEESGYKEMYKIMTENSMSMHAFNFNCQILNKNDRDTKYLMMEKLRNVDNLEECNMLFSILPKIFAYDKYFCHSDMKIGHIMKTATNEYTIIDLMLSKKKLLYGYIRDVNKPANCFINIVTIKDDIVELLTSIIRRYTKDYSWLPISGINENEYASALLVALNIDNRRIDYNIDIELIFKNLEKPSNRRKTNSILYDEQNHGILNSRIKQLLQ
jgi:hypothetical protein